MVENKKNIFTKVYVEAVKSNVKMLALHSFWRCPQSLVSLALSASSHGFSLSVWDQISPVREGHLSLDQGLPKPSMASSQPGNIYKDSTSKQGHIRRFQVDMNLAATLPDTVQQPTRLLHRMKTIQLL